MQHGNSMRGYDGSTCVTLCAADSPDAEAQCVIQGLRDWHRKGYAWDDMAVLGRNKLPVSLTGWRVLGLQ